VADILTEIRDCQQVNPGTAFPTHPCRVAALGSSACHPGSTAPLLLAEATAPPTRGYPATPRPTSSSLGDFNEGHPVGSDSQALDVLFQAKPV